MLSAHYELKPKQLLAPVFMAITGSLTSTSVIDAMTILGSDMTRARLRHAIDVLGGFGKKKLKALEKTALQLPASA